MSTMEEPPKHCPSKMAKLDNALKLAEKWVSNMTRAVDDDHTEVEGQPSRLGLGAKVPHQSKLGPFDHLLERKLYAKLDAQTRITDESTLVSRYGCGDDSDDDEDLESRTKVFDKRKAAKVVATCLHTKKRQKYVSWIISTTIMDGSPQATNSNPDKVLDPDNAQTGIADNDQRFLLFFIMGTYFGPDIKGESPQKSVLQRIAEGLPPYTSDQLAQSQIKTVEIERIYHYVLRKANQSFVVLLPLLRQFFQGDLPKHVEDPSANYPQFPDLFPPSLHLHPQYRSQNKTVENIFFINEPEIFFIDQKDIERFRRLTGLEDFVLDEDAARLHIIDGEVLHNGEVKVNDPDEDCESKKTRRVDELLELDDPLKHDHLMVHLNSDLVDRAGPAMVFLPSFPTKSELSNIVAATKSGFALTGSAAMGNMGPSIGLMDIGECEDSYLFRISLPGVKRDARDFSCEVESDGKVLIRGVATTGEKTVLRYSQMFEMQTQNLCPAGRFSISFKLPGPVDPQQFSGNFGTDGILEGIVMKERDGRSYE